LSTYVTHPNPPPILKRLVFSVIQPSFGVDRVPKTLRVTLPNVTLTSSKQIVARVALATVNVMSVEVPVTTWLGVIDVISLFLTAPVTVLAWI